MKQRNIILLSFLILVAFSFSSCSDYGYADGYGDNEEEMLLDTDLYGTWSFGEGENEASWTFNSDGTCTQMLYGVDYEWKWEIENSQLKLYVDNGTPAYKTYKVEGDKLYLWVDMTGEWGLPYTKQ